MKNYFMIILGLVICLPVHQAKAECVEQRVDQWIWDLAKLDLEARQAEKDSDKKATAAGQGLEMANCCLKTFPSDMGCTYYRGVHQGWMLDARIKNVKEGLQAMKADFNTVEKSSSAYQDDAMRSLGYLYLSLPVIPLFGRDFSRDLPLAQTYADKALKLSPGNPENLQLMGELALKRGDKAKAREYFAEGLRILSLPKDMTNLQRQIYREIMELDKKAK